MCTCNGHTGSCGGHAGYDPPLGNYSWTDDPVDTDDYVKATHYNELKTTINTEFTRRGLSPSAGFPPADKDTDDVVYGADYRLLRDHIRTLAFANPGDATWDTAIPSACGYGSMAPATKILGNTTNEMRSEVDTLRGECICDCNYSCTCNCNYCVCNCNHSCTCNCNYSDERLKEDIVYL